MEPEPLLLIRSPGIIHEDIRNPGRQDQRLEQVN